MDCLRSCCPWFFSAPAALGQPKRRARPAHEKGMTAVATSSLRGTWSAGYGGTDFQSTPPKNIGASGKTNGVGQDQLRGTTLYASTAESDSYDAIIAEATSYVTQRLRADAHFNVLYQSDRAAAGAFAAQMAGYWECSSQDEVRRAADHYYVRAEINDPRNRRIYESARLLLDLDAGSPVYGSLSSESEL